MYHPLLPDLSTFSDDELLTKYNELNLRWLQANRAGSVSVLGQMSMVMECYKQEMRRRHDKMMADMSKRNPQFKNIIDIK